MVPDALFWFVALFTQVNAKDMQGRTALHLAALRADKEPGGLARGDSITLGIGATLGLPLIGGLCRSNDRDLTRQKPGRSHFCEWWLNGSRRGLGIEQDSKPLHGRCIW